MKRLLFSLVAASAVLLASPLAQGEGPVDETRITLRHEFLRIINRDRAENGLRPVELDPESSIIADNYCREQIRNRTSGHFTLDGLPPYMRYSFAGGNDGVGENAAAWSADYRFSDRALYEMIVRSEQAMMRETAPLDGHRRTILDPNATHVGIGLAWEGGEFRITQEFVHRYVNWKWPLPRVAALTERATAAGTPVNGYRVEAISVYHEPLPRPMTVAEANLRNSYNLPGNRRDYLPQLRRYYERRSDGSLYEMKEEYVDGRRGDFTVATDKSFAFDVPFSAGPGVYTVVVWVRRDSAPPIPASNISIRVDPPRADTSYAGGGTK
jgi:uncharacterized protein YkwD